MTTDGLDLALKPTLHIAGTLTTSASEVGITEIVSISNQRILFGLPPSWPEVFQLGYRRRRLASAEDAGDAEMWGCKNGEIKLSKPTEYVLSMWLEIKSVHQLPSNTDQM